MKILIVISVSFCANFIRGQGKYLTGQGHDVIIVSGPGEEIDELEKRESIRVIRVPFEKDISLWSDSKNLWKITKIVKLEKPDIINAGNPKSGFLFSLAHVLFWNIPLVFTLRGVRSDTLTGFKKRVVRITEKITCKLSNKVIAISPSLKEHAVELNLVSRDKCIVLSKGSSNGIDISYYSPSDAVKKSAKKICEKYNISDSSFKVLFVGRLTRDKGIIELINALKICWKSGAEIDFVVAGPIDEHDPLPDEYYDLLENHPNIYYVGKQLDIRPVYMLGTILVLYSYREGFGNVAIEASSMGLPTVVANIPGLKDTTVHEETGLLVVSKNSKELSKGILKLYNSPDVVEEMGSNGRKRVIEYFQNETVWSKQLELYSELVKCHS